MQTKSSYRVLKWTLLLGGLASLVSACVVTSGDGNISGDGGESGTTTDTAGKSSTAGTGGSSSTAGKANSAGTGGSATAGTSSNAGGEGGAGGAAYEPGICDAAVADVNKGALPTQFPSCAPATDGTDDGDTKACKRCLKDKCCPAWQNCYGSEPHTACGWGPHTKDDDGQWDCLQNCIGANKTGEATPEALLTTCSAECTNQCDAADGGNLLVATSDLVTCANDPMTCQDICFPF